MSEQIIGTLYGVGAINDREANGKLRRRRCLYFYSSTFHGHPELDGAILIDPSGICLLVNDYGRRCDRVRQCGLARFLAQHNALFDMGTWERAFDCLVADFEMDPRDERAVLDRLRRKYPNRNLQLMTWHRYEGFAAPGYRDNT